MDNSGNDQENYDYYKKLYNDYINDLKFAVKKYNRLVKKQGVK